MQRHRAVSEVRLHHRGHLRGLAGGRPARADRDEAAHARRVQAMSTFAVGEEAEQNAPGGDSRSRQGVGPGGRGGHRARTRAARRASMSWCARARSATSSPAARWTRSTSGWNCRRKDADGRVVYWSGSVTEDGKGPVEPGAHFYRSYQLDGEGNPDQQAQCLAGAQRAVCAADSARRGRRGALPRAGSAATPRARSSSPRS